MPEGWLAGLDVATQVASVEYNTSRNRFRVNCGAKDGKGDPFGQLYWEKKDWIEPQDPYGWFHWYTRFYRGRRSDDDFRQITRWMKCAGKKGRWKQNLIGKCLRDGKEFDDETVSPVVRQTLQHWAYKLTEEDFEVGAKRVKTHGAAYVPRSELAGIVKPSQKGRKK